MELVVSLHMFAAFRQAPTLSARANVAFYVDGGPPMPSILNNMATIVAGLVFLVLVAGLLNLLRTDGGNMSQKLMRWRVGLQFAAIVLVAASVWLAKQF